VPSLTNLEIAAIRTIIDEIPEWRSVLTHQLELVEVADRENTGGGFFTDLRIPDSAPAVVGQTHLGETTHAAIDGLEYGVGLILFLKEGRMDLLEGYSVGGEDTKPIDWERIGFRITDHPTSWSRAS
jgi:hypothetical protein